MAITVRPRRSVLYMPGSNARALEKAKSLPADGLILDLEDATAPDAKNVAREQVCNAAKEGGYGNREVIIRANGLQTKWGYDDVCSVATSGADAILLPKVESASQIRQVEQILDEHEAPENLAIWCMMETPLGMLNAKEIAAAGGRLAGFVMGTSDLAKDLHSHHTDMRLPMITSLGICMLAARAYGLQILDGVYLDLNDADGFKASCVQGLELGFDGKTLIHPKQVAPCNDVFAPSDEAIEHSRKIIAAYEEVLAQGKNVVLVDGKLVENLHVENAKRLVALADAIAAAASDSGAGQKA
jgi:citrate lyase subunit beta / citryl-CoA lyase